jgi:hypothetical protein
MTNEPIGPFKVDGNIIAIMYEDSTDWIKVYRCHEDSLGAEPGSDLVEDWYSFDGPIGDPGMGLYAIQAGQWIHVFFGWDGDIWHGKVNPLTEEWLVNSEPFEGIPQGKNLYDLTFTMRADGSIYYSWTEETYSPHYYHSEGSTNGEKQ